MGPGDAGPASSRQVILDFLNRRLPGVPPATSSVVDARDVAEAMWLAAVYGRRLSGARAPRWSVPTQLLWSRRSERQMKSGHVATKPAG